MELQLSPDQTLLVLGILFAVAVGFLIPRKPAEDFIEWALQDMERNPHSHRYRPLVGVILLALIIGFDSEYSYGVIGLLIGFAINFGLFVFWR
jgi:hypothetical protein